MEIKESKKVLEYTDIFREVKMLLNILVTGIRTIDGALGTVAKGLDWGLEQF